MSNLDSLRAVVTPGITNDAPLWAHGQWHHGNYNEPGTLIIPDKFVVAHLATLPQDSQFFQRWKKQMVTFRGGKSELCWVSADSVLTFVATRFVWYIEVPNGQEYLTGYVQGAKGKLHALAYVQGLGDFPVSFTFTGTASRGMKQAYWAWVTKVVKPLNYNQNVAVPNFALWFNVRSAKAEEVGSGKNKSITTQPYIAMPKVIDNAYVETVVLSLEEYRFCEGLYTSPEVRDWIAEWKPDSVQKAKAAEVSAQEPPVSEYEESYSEEPF